MTAIRVRSLEKSYKQLHVLRGVDFDVERGSIFALLGSNGAGKTTAVRILATLLKPDAGTAAVTGFDVVTQAGDVRAAISLTGQFAAVDEILSGRENLVLIARLRRLKQPGKIADDLLARFSLTDAATRKVSTYSGGMRRRLDIAMSLIGDLSVIFLDEPTTGLDPRPSRIRREAADPRRRLLRRRRRPHRKRAPMMTDTTILLGRSLRHITRSLDTIITPIAMMLMFGYVFGGAIDTGTGTYIDYMLPGILLITIASGIAYTALRLFTDLKSGIFERFHVI
ncbi:ATP-binding cassette domain-containing protein [Amycolatopsis sp. NPDC004747]